MRSHEGRGARARGPERPRPQDAPLSRAGERRACGAGVDGEWRGRVHECEERSTIWRGVLEVCRSRQALLEAAPRPWGLAEGWSRPKVGLCVARECVAL